MEREHPPSLYRVSVTVAKDEQFSSAPSTSRHHLCRCIQELVRHLSVHCMEQGQLLAFVWSSYVQALRKGAQHPRHQFRSSGTLPVRC